MQDDDIIAAITPSAPRRYFGTGVLYALGFVLVWICFVQPPSAVAVLFLLLCAAVAIYGGYSMWVKTARKIELTEQELRMSDGTTICRIEDIHKVDRSFFAFKPSNGFLISMKTRHPYAWAPGLWWRVGKRVGIGGVVSGAESKMMADTMSAMLAVRDGLIEDFPPKAD
jgi:hypothetical protein